MTRRRLTPKQRQRLLAEYGGKCAECGDSLDGLPWVADHIHQLAMGGGNEWENFRPLCQPCTRVKDREDAGRRGKVRRLSGLNKQRAKRRIQSPGFDKTLRKRMDGTVVKIDA